MWGIHEFDWTPHGGSSSHSSWTITVSGDRSPTEPWCFQQTQRVWYLGQVWHILVQKYANQWTLSFVSQLHSSPGRSAVDMGVTYSSAPHGEIIKLNSSQFSLGTLWTTLLLSPRNTQACRWTNREPTVKYHWEENEGHNGPEPSVWVQRAVP